MSLADGRMSAACSSGSPLYGCASLTFARSCLASRRLGARTADRARSMCGLDASICPRPGPSGASGPAARTREYADGSSSLLLGTAVPVQLMRGGIALDADVSHGLRAKLDRAVEDPSPIARLAPGAARDKVNVARPALHRPNLLVGADGSDRRKECDNGENSEF